MLRSRGVVAVHAGLGGMEAEPVPDVELAHEVGLFSSAGGELRS